MLREALARIVWRRQTCPADEAFMRDWKARDHRRQYDVVWIGTENKLYVQVWSVSAIGGHQWHQYQSMKAAVQDITLREIYEA